MAFKPSQKRRKPPEDVELNTTPIMNLMVVLIPLLLAGAKFTELTLLEYLPPAEATAASDTGAPPEEGSGGGGEEKLNLLLNLVDAGIQISLFGSVKEGEHFYVIPKSPDGNYNWKALNDSLVSVKQNIVGPQIGTKTIFNERDSTYQEVPAYKYADATEVSITALSSTHFQTIVNAMDACQKYSQEEFINGERQVAIKELFPVTILKQFQ